MNLNITAVTVSVPIIICDNARNYIVSAVSGYQMPFHKFDELVSETFGCPDGKFCPIYNSDNVSKIRIENTDDFLFIF